MKALDAFAALPLTDMAAELASYTRRLDELRPIPPCDLCKPEGPCWVHRGEQAWHRAIGGQS